MLGSSFGDLGQFGGNLARGTISGFAAGLTSSVMRGGHIELTQVATDAFGNALGSSLASMGLSGSATSNRGDSITGLNSDISTYNGMTAQGVLDSLGPLSIPHDGYIGSSTYGLGELHAAGLNVSQASRFFMSPDEGGSAPRMGDTGPMNEEVDPTIPAVTITGHRMSFFEKIGSYFGDASDAIKDVFSTQDFSQKSDYQMAQYPFSNVAANTERVNRAAARGQLPYTMGGVLSDVTKLGIKGGAAMAAFPYAASMVGRMGASQGYSILGASMLTDAGLQTVNNLDGSQRGWSSIQSAVSVGLPLAALGAKPAAMWLASGLESGVNVGGFKILDPSGARMYAPPPSGASSVTASETAAVNGPKVFATFNGNVIEPSLTNQPLFHGVNMTWDEIANTGGLPMKGTDIDLLNHLNGGPNSAFRGTNLWADSPLANGNGPVSWAGEGGTVVKIDGSRIPSYDANSLTSGSVRNFDGSFSDHMWTGEAEFPIHAQVPLDSITHYGVVVESRSGALRVQQWIENPFYKK